MNLDKRDIITVLIIVVLMLIPRLIVAPYTSGSDIPQFAGFADTFLRHGLCFYKFADTKHSSTENWPYSWPYVYGPGLVLFLAPLRLLASSPIIHYWDQQVYYVYVSMDWIIASKSLFILFDVLSTIMIYVIIRGLGYKWKSSAILASLYAFNPMTIYISSIYGMFDQIPLFFFLVGIYLLYVRSGDKSWRKILGAFSSGLSIGFKHTFLFSAALIFYDLIMRRDKRFRKTLFVSSLVIGALVLFIPFELACFSSIEMFINNALSSSEPGYTYPVCYSFNGLSSLATYINEHTGKNMMFLIEYWWLPAITLLAMILIAYLGYRDPIVYSSLAYIVFTTTYWRVNHQYLVPAIAFSIILFAKLRGYTRCRFLAILYIFLIGLWPIMFPTSWWAHVHIREPNMDIWNLLDRFSLMVFDEESYLLYSLVLTITGYIFVFEVVSAGLSRIHYRVVAEKIIGTTKKLLRIFPRISK
ncbi:hypothetical protein [Staphylothermus hellenicus]|uniref:hypothetical protein n=1 Tax=Staphylothermus hellenicus TaxID=84599 RepID=UPI001FDEB158|nr:hypothetical protein [Staphylothermus hellenicus]